MFKIQTLNNIDPIGLKQFPQDRYHIASDITDPDALLVRSASLHGQTLPKLVKVIARAGAGVNNIPVDQMTQLGIPVLNTPGANANAVKELVLAGMLLACRNLCQAWDYTRNLQGDNTQISQQVEQHKKQFLGSELPGKTLGIIGLGNIGVKVANAAIGLGMRVLGYDPSISVRRAWELSSYVEEMTQLERLIQQSDFISIHVPLLPETRHLINAERLSIMKPNAILLNFSREEIVDKAALLEALHQRQLATYVCDFPCQEFTMHPQVISFPHLGASTREAEQTCAVMAVKQIRDFLEHGTINNSVNFPSVDLPEDYQTRLTIVNLNIPNMVAQISSKIADARLNIVDLLNKSREQIAYTVIDVNGDVAENLLADIRSIEGVVNVRCLVKA